MKFKSSKRVPKIYTKTGDGGNSSLYTGERRHKTDKVFEALGDVDELACQIGLAREQALMSSTEHPFVEQLVRVQCILQDINSVVATPASSARDAHKANVGVSERHAVELEEWIDEYTENLPPLENFILPGGGVVAAQIHVARTTCRRAERRVVGLVGEGECEAEAGRYLNRLSDFLFTMARVASRLENKAETIYTRPDKEPIKYQNMGTMWKKKTGAFCVSSVGDLILPKEMHTVVSSVMYIVRKIESIILQLPQTYYFAECIYDKRRQCHNLRTSLTAA